MLLGVSLFWFAAAEEKEPSGEHSGGQIQSSPSSTLLHFSYSFHVAITTIPVLQLGSVSVYVLFCKLTVLCLVFSLPDLQVFMQNN
jgi:hypothetical protein